MSQTSYQPNDFTNTKQLPAYAELAAQNVMLKEQVHQMLEELQKLRDEIARLKKQNTKPKIGPSKFPGKKKGKTNVLHIAQPGAQTNAQKQVRAAACSRSTRFAVA